MTTFDMNNAVVLITGASGGIGSALAAAFTSNGATVVGTDLAGRRADMELDVSNRDATNQVMRRVVAEHGRLDIVVANAGIAHAGFAADCDDAIWDRTIDVNIRGAVNTVRAALAVLSERGHGHIVVMSSLAGLVGVPLLAAYSMSKFAVKGLADSIRPEAATRGVGVTVVCPGPIDTSLIDEPSLVPGMSVRRYLSAGGGKPMPPSELAAVIVDAVRRNKPLVVPGRPAVVHRIGRWAPGVARRAIAKEMDNELERARVDVRRASAPSKPTSIRPPGALGAEPASR
jgi:NAD(P)-dependent dehydrogenase (short-subunit alcohol dehydrogenase family)